MNKIISIREAILIVLLFASMGSYGQNISVTFTATGAAAQIDSVTATNQSTGESVTLPGNETLVLGANTGIPSFDELSGTDLVFPNPFSGQTTFSTVVSRAQTVDLRIQNLVGRIVAQTTTWIQPGENVFDLVLSASGVYLVSLSTEEGIRSYKVICTGESGSEDRIQYMGMGRNFERHFSRSGRKGMQTGYTLGFTSGEIIHYRCKSGIYTTIVTDSPVSSKNYEVDLSECTDPSGRNYAVVRIGNQIWMAENLAYLPAVSPSSRNSSEQKYYYVYGYDGFLVDNAKSQENYAVYGVLYNWPAAMNGSASSNASPSGVKGICPTGWHLPSDAEWMVLTNYLTNNGFGYLGSGTAIGKSLASSWDWAPNSVAGTVGNDQPGNNRCGFTALPGGYCLAGTDFRNRQFSGNFWSSTELDATAARYYYLIHNMDNLARSVTFKKEGFSVRCIRD